MKNRLQKRKDNKNVNSHKEKIQNNKTKKLYIIATIIIIILFSVMLFVFYQNITLKLERNKLNKYLEEYQLLKEKIDYLTEIKENYNIIVENNNNLSIKKTELENKIEEINKSISNMNTKIDKLK